MGAADSVGDYLSSWVTFLVISISSSQVAYLAPLIKLPMITGYLLFGILCGPYILQLVSTTDISNLQPITQTALAFISFAAGSELYLPELKQLYRRIMALTLSVSVICFWVITLVFYGLAHSNLIPFMYDITSNSCKFSISMLAGSIMVTQSPSSSIAIVREMKAKGPFTSTMLGVCVISDVLVLFIFSICLSITNATCVTGEFDIVAILTTIGSIVCAVLLGYGLGKLIILLIWLPHVHGEYAILPIGFGVFKFNEWFTDWSNGDLGVGLSVDPLLVCITAGYIISNHSRNRRKFLHFMNKAAPIVFIPFFTLTGAGLNLKVMGQCAGMAVIIFIVRAITYLCGVVSGGYYSGMPMQHIQTMWLAMITQAGVSLGIAAEVAIHFTDWGSQFQSAIIAIVLINQICGPVLLKWTIRKNGEAGKASADEEDLEHGQRHRALLLGVNAHTLGLAQRLLYSDWNVIVCDADVKKLGLCDRLVVPVEEGVVPVTKVNADGVLTQTVTPESSAVDTVKNTMDEIKIKLNDVIEMKQPRVNADGVTIVDMPVAQPIKKKKDTTPPTAAPVILPTHVDEHEHTEISRVETYHLNMCSAVSETDLYQAELIEQMKLITNKFNLTNTTLHSTIIALPSDEFTYAVAEHLINALQLHRMVSVVHNIAWTQLFTSIGALPVSAYNTTTHLLHTCATSDTPAAFMQHTSIVQSLEYMVQCDNHSQSVYSNDILSMTSAQRKKRHEQYPPPPPQSLNNKLLLPNSGTTVAQTQQADYYDALSSTAQPSVHNKLRRTMADATNEFAAHTSHLSVALDDDDELDRLKHSRQASAQSDGTV